MPDYDKEQRAAAARKGWEKRRANDDVKLKLPDHGVTSDAGSIPPGVTDETDVGAVLPVIRDVLAGGIAKWEDTVFNIDATGYQLIRTCPAVLGSVQKLAYRTAALDLVVVGEGERAEAIQEITDQAEGVPEMIEWATWARPEGLRFMQIKEARSLEGENIWTVPNFIGGGRKKQNAGGQIQWDGTRLMQIFQTTGVAKTDPKVLPLENFIIFRPGAGSNPEGDLELGIALYRVAYNWTEAFKSMDKLTELFSVPMRILEKKVNKVRPTQVPTILTDGAVKLAAQQRDQVFAMSSEDVIKLLQPLGRPLNDMVEYAVYLEGVVDQLLLGNTLTSQTMEAGPAGSSMVHLSEEDKFVFHNAHLIAQPLNTHLIPWIERKNELPELAEGEQEPYYQFQPMGQREGEQTAISGEEDLSGEVQETKVEPGTPAVEEVGLAHGGELLADLRESKPLGDEGEVFLAAGETDHTHTAELDENGDGSATFSESEAAGFHGHEVAAGVVQAGGRNNHTHPIEIHLRKPYKVVKKGNPFKIEKRGNKFVVIKTSDGKVMGTHSTKAKATAQFRALEANVKD